MHAHGVILPGQNSFYPSHVLISCRTWPPALLTPALRHLTLDTVTGTYFDLRSLHEVFAGADLRCFTYRMGHSLAFEMRDSHLRSLPLLGQNLRKLVLLGCSRFSSLVLQEVLVDLHELEYLALDIVTVQDSELEHDFITPISASLRFFKFRIFNEKLSIEHIVEEGSLADAFESLLRRGSPPLKLACLHLRDAVIEEGGRRSRLHALAEQQSTHLRLGDWKNDNEVYDH